MSIPPIPSTPPAGNGALPAAPPEPPAADAAPGFGAIRTLRLLVFGAIILPLLLAAGRGYFSFRASYDHATAALAQAAVVAEENTTKVLDTHMLVAARIDDLLAGLSDDDIRGRQLELHNRIAEQIAHLPEVAAAWVIGTDGQELVSARVYPVNGAVDHANRDDFRALRDGRVDSFIEAVRARSLDSGDYRPYFTVSRRRPAPDGGFGGIVVVAVSGDYFASFYKSLLGGSAQYTASISREDGTVLARYPPIAPSAPQRADDQLLAQAIAAKAKGGIISSGSTLLGVGTVLAYKRLASYPVYVAIGRSQASILREWAGSLIGYAAIGIPAALGFVLLSLLALRRTRREQLALAQARDATAQRAAIEAQLHQAQKMEAVGLLTAGIAHDFNNLLTIVSGNIALIGAELDEGDPKRQKFITAATTACERASALTQRLLGFARREPIDPRPVDINAAITTVAELPWRSLGDRIAAEFRLSTGLWPAYVDPNQLENALLNLALNARDAMTGIGTLTIETRNCRGEPDAADEPGAPPVDYVAIIVSDTGSGMPPEVRERAFDPFFTTKAAGKGSGLGLSQVHGFVTRFGGRCTIESELGHGTTITLYLPRYLGEDGDEPGEPREIATLRAY